MDSNDQSTQWLNRCSSMATNRRSTAMGCLTKFEVYFLFIFKLCVSVFVLPLFALSDDLFHLFHLFVLSCWRTFSFRFPRWICSFFQDIWPSLDNTKNNLIHLFLCSCKPLPPSSLTHFFFIHFFLISFLLSLIKKLFVNATRATSRRCCDAISAWIIFSHQPFRCFLRRLVWTFWQFLLQLNWKFFDSFSSSNFLILFLQTQSSVCPSSNHLAGQPPKSIPSTHNFPFLLVFLYPWVSLFLSSFSVDVYLAQFSNKHWIFVICVYSLTSSRIFVHLFHLFSFFGCVFFALFLLHHLVISVWFCLFFHNNNNDRQLIWNPISWQTLGKLLAAFWLEIRNCIHWHLSDFLFWIFVFFFDYTKNHIDIMSTLYTRVYIAGKILFFSRHVFSLAWGCFSLLSFFWHVWVYGIFLFCILAAASFYSGGGQVLLLLLLLLLLIFFFHTLTISRPLALHIPPPLSLSRTHSVMFV